MSEKGDNIKIREDALKIKEKDIEDTLKSIDSENTKTSFALAFESLLVVQSLNFLTKNSLCIIIPYAIAILVAIIIALWNLVAKKVYIHTNVDDIFCRKDRYNDWNTYLDQKYERFKQTYTEAKRLLNAKANLTIATFISLIIALLILLVGGIYAKWR